MDEHMYMQLTAKVTSLEGLTKEQAKNKWDTAMTELQELYEAASLTSDFKTMKGLAGMLLGMLREADYVDDSEEDL